MEVLTEADADVVALPFLNKAGSSSAITACAVLFGEFSSEFCDFFSIDPTHGCDCEIRAGTNFLSRR